MTTPLAMQQQLQSSTPYWMTPKQREEKRQENEIAKLLQQATLDTRQGQAQGIQLQNQQRQKRLQDGNPLQQAQIENLKSQIASRGQPNPVQQAQIDNIRSQIEARNAPKPKVLTPAQERLAPYLPAELAPESATTKDWVAAASAMKAGKQPNGPKLAQHESQASGFYERMIADEKALATLPQDFDPASYWEWMKSGTNLTKSSEMQQYENSANDWIRAKLRQESGAAIGEKEMEDEYKIYFPVPGDTAATIKAKAAKRKIAAEAMRKSAGPGLAANNDGWEIID